MSARLATLMSKLFFLLSRPFLFTVLTVSRSVFLASRSAKCSAHLSPALHSASKTMMKMMTFPCNLRRTSPLTTCFRPTSRTSSPSRTRTSTMLLGLVLAASASAEEVSPLSSRFWPRQTALSTSTSGSAITTPTTTRKPKSRGWPARPLLETSPARSAEVIRVWTSSEASS